MNESEREVYSQTTPASAATSNAMTVPTSWPAENGDTALAELEVVDAAFSLPAVREGRIEEEGEEEEVGREEDEDVLRLSDADLVAPAAGMVVEANPTPLGPMLMVSPSTTIVVGVAEGPIS